LTGEKIDEFDEFLSIRQHFTHQNFLLIIFSCRLPTCQTTFSRRALLLVDAPMKFFCQYFPENFFRQYFPDAHSSKFSLVKSFRHTVFKVLLIIF